MNKPQIDKNGAKSDTMNKVNYIEKIKVMNNLHIDEDGTKRWYDQEGRNHRVDGPAIEYPDGEMRWYQHGQLHRDDGPAIERIDGSEDWYQHGQFHRDDGPTIKHPGPNGFQAWHQRGELHRMDGPALLGNDGYHTWYFQGQLLINVKSQEDFERFLKLRAFW